MGRWKALRLPFLWQGLRTMPHGDSDDNDDHDTFDHEHSNHHHSDHRYQYQHCHQRLAFAREWFAPLVGILGAVCHHTVLDGSDSIALDVVDESDPDPCLCGHGSSQSSPRFSFELIMVPEEAHAGCLV